MKRTRLALFALLVTLLGLTGLRTAHATSGCLTLCQEEYTLCVSRCGTSVPCKVECLDAEVHCDEDCNGAASIH